MDKKVLFWFKYVAILIVSVIVLLEVASRIIVPHGRENPLYLEMSTALPELQDLLRDKKSFTDQRYYDYFVYSVKPGKSKTMSFDGYGSARRTPDSFSEADADTRIWTFGGSTMQNMETTDRLTIANSIARRHKRLGLRSHVSNFGAGSFQSSLELIKFTTILARTDESRKPDVVVFYDGFNDSNHAYLFGAGRMQADISGKISALVENRPLVMLAYGSSQLLADYSRLWRLYGAPIVASQLLFPSPPRNASSANLEKAVDIYLQNIQMERAVCASIEATCLFVLQPLLVSKQGLSRLEQDALATLESDRVNFVRAFYQNVRDRTVDQEDFIDASHILDYSDRNDFYDLGHTSALSSSYIGEWIADAIIAHLKTNKPP
jgi:hypothetical protein